MECLRQIRAFIASTAPPEDAIGFEQFSHKSEIGLQCDCMPACHEIVSIIVKMSTSASLLNLFQRYGHQTMYSDRSKAPNGPFKFIPFSIFPIRVNSNQLFAVKSNDMICFHLIEKTKHHRLLPMYQRC